MDKINILTYGEILWDIIGGKEYLGGAPFNLAVHFHRLGGESWVISSLGDDFRGSTILQQSNQHGVHSDFLFTSTNLPTGIVEVKLTGKGIPDFDIIENVAWDDICIDDKIITRIKAIKFQAFCFGTLAQRNVRSSSSLCLILENIDFDEILFDVNIRKQYFSKTTIETSLSYTTILKLNNEEVGILSKSLFSKTLSESDFVEKIFANYKVKIIALTKGDRGCTIYTRDHVLNIPGIPIVVADTVGAGDAFSAAFLYEYLKTHDIKKSATIAVKVSAFVASKSGAIPDHPSEKFDD